MYGGEGVDVLLGENGNDYFDGGSGVDYYFGGAGNDIFVAKGETGAKVINDFTSGQDVIRLEGTPIRSFADVLANTTDLGSYSIVTLDPDSNVWIIGKTSATLTASDFIFV
jgi:Ca2+-binding RTX toxin-like protein